MDAYRSAIHRAPAPWLFRPKPGIGKKKLHSLPGLHARQVFFAVRPYRKKVLRLGPGNIWELRATILLSAHPDSGPAITLMEINGNRAYELTAYHSFQ
jgi:hypothetical protein